MCFKQNHSDMTTIENVKLNGGECKGAYSLNEMKSRGWTISDIKITEGQNNTNNFVYILNSGQLTTNFSNYSNVSQDELEERLLRKLEQKRVEEKKQKEKELILSKIEDGKTIYEAKCSSCHGEKGEISVYGVSKPMNELSLADLKYSIRGYKRSEIDNGYGIVMTPYARSVNEEDLKNIHNYLKSINKNQKVDTK
jgi:cytochrome c553